MGCTHCWQWCCEYKEKADEMNIQRIKIDNQKETLTELEKKVKLIKINDQISGIFMPNEIIMNSIEVKQETMEKINEIISSSKSEDDIFSKLDKSLADFVS